MFEERQVIYNRYRYVVKLFVLTIGLWPSKQSNTSQHIIRLTHLGLILFLLFGFFMFCKEESNISQFVGGLGFILAHVSHIIKVSCILVNYQDFRDLKKIVDKKFNQLLSDEKIRECLLKEVYTFYRLNINVTISVAIFGVFSILSPIIILLVQYLHHVPIITHPLVYQSAYPWGVPTHGFGYWVTYILQATGVIDGVIITTGVDSIYIFYIFQMVGLLFVLTHRLKNLNQRDDYHVILRQCIDEYEILIKCRDKIQEIFGPIILWTILSNGLVMCTMVFQITRIKSMPLIRMITLIIYVYYKLSQTFMYVWTGTRLTKEVAEFFFQTDSSERYQEAAADIGWQTNSKLKSASLIMLPQRPLQLVACHFLIVSVDLFLKVLNTAVSYFFLISTLEEK